MAVSKHIRFEVFKRDGFACQYCGRTPPQVVLELDHIVPKCKGGKEQIHDYITACFDCNRGKGKKKLTELPPPIKDKLPTLKEKYEQLRAYNEYLKGEDAFYDKCIERMQKTFSDEYPNEPLLARISPNTLRHFLRNLPTTQVEAAMIKACSSMHTPYATIKYFCGICWNAIKSPVEVQAG